jgi:cell division protease FtsH
MLDFEMAKDKVYMGTETPLDVISDDEKRTTAVHEAGHTLISVLINHHDPSPQGHDQSRAVPHLG